MSEVKWVLSKMGAEDIEPLKHALESQGFECKVVENDVNGDCLGLFDPDDCVVFFGTLGLAAHVKRKSQWVPGVYHNVPHYRCTYYYPRLAKFILNRYYIMLPYGDLLRQKDFLYEHVGNQDVVFMRPDTGSKSFVGTTVYKEHYEKDIKNMGYGNIDPESLVVVAEPQNLDGEWRFVCVEGKVITGSQYKDKLGLKVKKSIPKGALELAQQVADTGFQPDPVYCIDIGRREHYGDYKLVEVGCFSCAGLYATDKDIIAKEVSAIALKEWESYQ